MQQLFSVRVRLVYLLCFLGTWDQLKGTEQVTSEEITESYQSRNKTVAANTSVTFTCVSTANVSDVYFRWEHIKWNSWDIVHSIKTKGVYNTILNVTVDEINRRTVLHIFSAQTTDAGTYVCTSYDRPTRDYTSESLFDLTVIDSRSCSVQRKTPAVENGAIEITCSVNFVGRAIPSIECAHQSGQTVSSSDLFHAIDNVTGLRTLRSTATFRTVCNCETITCIFRSESYNSFDDKPLFASRLQVPPVKAALSYATEGAVPWVYLLLAASVVVSGIVGATISAVICRKKPAQDTAAAAAIVEPMPLPVDEGPDVSDYEELNISEPDEDRQPPIYNRLEAATRLKTLQQTGNETQADDSITTSNNYENTTV